MNILDILWLKYAVLYIIYVQHIFIGSDTNKKGRMVVVRVLHTRAHAVAKNLGYRHGHEH
jgi:uncharacterized membrane protein YhfC